VKKSRHTLEKIVKFYGSFTGPIHGYIVFVKDLPGNLSVHRS